MSDIDWSKAPEGATHWMPEGRSWKAGFWKREGEANYFFEGGEWAFSRAKPFGHPNLVNRPATPQWNGEGLPPVGVVCEREHEANKGAWHKAEIKYIGSAYVIVADSAGIEQHYYLRSMKFRPIRTPEQLAAEERERAVAQMLALDVYDASSLLGIMSRADFCRVLYDNNYRKVEQ